jgi:hypothetical protein
MLALTAMLAGTARADAQDGIPVRDARTALDSLGVVTHLDYSGTPYQQLDRVRSALRHLGVRRVRDMIPDANVGPYEALARDGVRFNFVVRGGRIESLDPPLRRLEDLERRFPGAVGSIEGLNEANIWPATFQGLQKFPAATAVQRELHARVRQSTVLRSVPVYALTLGGAGKQDFVRLGDLSDYADLGNAHVYFDTRPPADTLDFATRLARTATPRLDHLVITETGYASAGQRGKAVDETVQAKYLLTLIAETWKRESPATFIYQLADDRIDPRNWSYNLGLYRFDWRPKPAADALHRFLRRIEAAAAEPEGAACERRLATPSGATALWLRVPSGCLLLLWRELPLWNDITDTPRSVPTLHLSLDPRTAPHQLSLYDAFDDSERTPGTTPGGFTIELADRPVLLRWH